MLESLITFQPSRTDNQTGMAKVHVPSISESLNNKLTPNYSFNEITLSVDSFKSSSMDSETTSPKSPSLSVKERLKKFLKKYFLEGQSLNKSAEKTLEVDHQKLPFHERYRKYLAFVIPFVFWHAIWWSLAIRYNFFQLYPTRYEMAVTMIFGATVAGEFLNCRHLGFFSGWNRVFGLCFGSKLQSEELQKPKP